jgi:hypothetical protein
VRDDVKGLVLAALAIGAADLERRAIAAGDRKADPIAMRWRLTGVLGRLPAGSAAIADETLVLC